MTAPIVYLGTPDIPIPPADYAGPHEGRSTAYVLALYRRDRPELIAAQLGLWGRLAESHTWRNHEPSRHRKPYGVDLPANRPPFKPRHRKEVTQ